MGGAPSSALPAAPSVARPPPLRTDGSNAFARFSMETRVPRILEQVLSDDPELPDHARARVERLAAAIRADEPIVHAALPAPDHAEWDAACAAHAGESWLDAAWFFAENSVYRQLLGACRYWETGRDPFRAPKQRELSDETLWQAVKSLDALDDAAPRERLHALLALSLWGNRVDLSYAVGTAYGRAGLAEDWLIDDRARMARFARTGDVHIVTDNSGSELAMDLAIADAWMADFGARVTLHVKMHPTFVSDATASDVWATIDAMRAREGGTAERGGRLARAFAVGQLRLLPDFFWSGPRFLWDLPVRLRDELSGATLVILKGDANYRRAVGDAVWPSGATFAQATAGFPAPMACLRTMKSDALVGLPAHVTAQLDAQDAAWRVNGRRGLLQLSEGPSSGDASPKRADGREASP